MLRAQIFCIALNIKVSLKRSKTINELCCMNWELCCCIMKKKLIIDLESQQQTGVASRNLNFSFPPESVLNLFRTSAAGRARKRETQSERERERE